MTSEPSVPRGGKPRIFNIASDLQVGVGAVLLAAKQLGLAHVKNQLNAVTEDERQQIVRLLRSDPSLADQLSWQDGFTTTTTTTPPPVIDPPVPIRRERRTHQGMESLLDVGAKFGLTKLDLIPRVAEVDPESGLFKVRKTTERVCKQLLGPEADDKDTLGELVKKLTAKGVLSRKSIANLKWLLDHGNIASHVQVDPFDSEFTWDEVGTACGQLALVIDEIAARKLLPSLVTSAGQA